jgi:cyanophycin synthetase
MVDYAHNPEAISSICRMASQWGGRTVTGVVGAPGDRNDFIIEQAGRAAARFHRVIVREDMDLRGRAEGEVPALLRDAVKDEAPDREVRIIRDEAEALRTAVREMGENEVVVILYEKLEKVMKVLEEFGAVSIPTIEAHARHASLARM